MADSKSELRVLVTNPTGSAGALVVKALAGDKVPVRAAVRDTSDDAAKELAQQGAELVTVDTAEQDSLVAALKGVTKVVLTIPVVPEHQAIASAWINALRAVAESKGALRHVIYLSQAGADDPAFMFAHWHAWNEVLLGTVDGIKTTFIRAGVLFQDIGNFYSHDVRSSAQLVAPFGDSPYAYVDVRDIAKAIVKTVQDADSAHEGGHTLLGASGVTFQQLAVAISKVAGKEVTYKECTVPEFGRLMLGWGVPEVIVDGFCEMHMANHETKVLGNADDSISKYTGAPAASLDDYLKDHAHLFS